MGLAWLYVVSRPGSHSLTHLADMNIAPISRDASYDHVGATPVQHPEFRNGSMTMLDKELEQQNTERYLDRVAIEDEYRPDPWQPDTGIGTIELESEFDKWGLVGDQQS